MSDAKINQFDPGVRDVLIEQHDVLRLRGKKIKIKSNINKQDRENQHFVLLSHTRLTLRSK